MEELQSLAGKWGRSALPSVVIEAESETEASARESKDQKIHSLFDVHQTSPIIISDLDT